MDWYSLLKDLGIFTIGSFFIKELFSRMIKEKTIQYESELKRIANEHQIKFSKLHEERAVVIKELYSKFVDLNNKMFNLGKKYETSNELSMVKKWDQAVNSYYTFKEYYNLNRIYFNNGICKMIDDIISNCNKIFVDIDTYGMNKVDSSSELTDEQIAVLYKNWKKIEGIVSLKADLENEFKIILGVQEDENKK
ncbi:hypothetical protein CON34_10280 [Bacillus thuringiensis]|uniref:hypothetical protein n=1 Tax=Bacillus thuringiensis TaxID=1428 RepID=UPI000BEB8904|nr:hypothetical protein [Bacillus thuringiensis]MED4445594.1 hypothetical protein [Bacillus cereus]PEB49506.1 hypothetical protein COM82_02485 [Bacillus thuringiensis]PED27033.1 hypothetical protein CON34_10280 [Bacillus thuringiensis]